MERLLDLVEKYPLDFVSYLSSSLPIVVGALTHEFHKRVQRYIWLFFIFLFLKDSYSFLHIYYVLSNVYIQNLETLLEIGFAGLIYYTCFNTSLSKRVILYAGIMSFCIVVLAYSQERVSIISLLTFRIYSIGLSLAYFNKIIVDLRIKNILKHTMFWFSAGLLIYATGTFFVSLFSEFLFDPKLTNNEIFDNYWNVSNDLFVIFSGLSSIGLWVSKYDSKNLI